MSAEFIIGFLVGLGVTIAVAYPVGYLEERWRQRR